MKWPVKLVGVDWRRDASFWADAMREKEVRGTKTLTFIGGGFESWQTIRRKIHQHLGTWELLQKKHLNEEGLEASLVAAAAD